MEKFIEEIEADIEWRMGQLSMARTLPLERAISEERREFILKYSVVAIYSIWEGFVKKSFEQYIFAINSQKITGNNLHINLLTHTIDNKWHFSNPRTNYESKIQFVQALNDIFNQDILIDSEIPTKSNVKFKVINSILNIFNLEELPTKYKSKLDYFVNIRNTVAHGDKSITIDYHRDVEEFCLLIQELMNEIIVRIEEGYNNKTFLKINALQ